MKILQCFWAIVLFLGCGYTQAQIEPVRNSLSTYQATIDSITLHSLKRIYPDSINIIRNDSFLKNKTIKAREKIEPILKVEKKNKWAGSLVTSELRFFDGESQGFLDFKSKEIHKVKQAKESFQGSLTEKKIPDNKLDFITQFDSLSIPNEMEKWRQKGDDALLMQPDSMLQFFTNDMEEKAKAEFQSFSKSEFDLEDEPVSFDNLINKESIGSETNENKRILEKMKQADNFKNHDSLSAKKEKLVEMKNKYKDVADSRDLKGMIKKSSLKHLPFHQRLEYGIMVANPSIKPFRPDFNLMVGYRININFSAGAGTSIGSIPGKRKDFLPNTVSFYALHRLRNNIFITGGYERMLNRAKNLQDKVSSSQEIFGGIGTDTTLKGNIRLRSQVTYGLNQAIGLSKKEYKPAFGIGIGIFYTK